MPLVSSDIPRLLEAGLKTVFMDQLVSGAAPPIERICTVVGTTTETTSYGWLGAPPRIRQFTDERIAKGVPQFGMSITDKTWEATIGVNRRAIENDNYGAIMLRVRQLADEARKTVMSMAWTMLREGGSATGATTYGRSWDNYDKAGTLTANTIYFNDTDHTYPPPGVYTTSQINVSNLALNSADVWTTYGYVRAFKTDNHTTASPSYCGMRPDLLVCSPKVEGTARALLTAAGIVPAADPQYINAIPQLGLSLEAPVEWTADVAANTSNWGLYDTSQAVKPLILQLFSPVSPGLGNMFEFTALEGNSDSGFHRDEYYYGIRGRFNLGWGDWRTSFLNIVA